MDKAETAVDYRRATKSFLKAKLAQKFRVKFYEQSSKSRHVTLYHFTDAFGAGVEKFADSGYAQRRQRNGFRRVFHAIFRRKSDGRNPVKRGSGRIFDQRNGKRNRRVLFLNKHGQFSKHGFRIKFQRNYGKRNCFDRTRF